MYKDILLPKTADLQWTSAAAWNTDVLQTASGREARNQNWDGTLMRGMIRYNARKQDVWRELDKMIQICAGRAHSFKVIDPRKSVAEAGEGVVIGGQMYLRVTFGAYSIDKKVTKPDASVVLNAGTFDPLTGIVSGGGTTWTGPFYLCCRFDADALEVTGVDKNVHEGLIAGFRDFPIFETRDE